jgi:hypothetical protein
MNEFEIFSYCSHNYMDAYEFVIDSWLEQSGASKITIYSDFMREPTRDKVEWVHLDGKIESWLDGTGARLNAIDDFVFNGRNTYQNYAFIDIDCLITGNISHVFDASFDIALARLFCTESYTHNIANAGVWFAKAGSGSVTFIKDWFQRAKKLKNDEKGIENYRVSYVQYAFTDVAVDHIDTGASSVLNLDYRVYNCEHSKRIKWYHYIRDFKPYIVHFKGRAFRDPEFVNAVNQLIAEYKDPDSITEPFKIPEDPKKSNKKQIYTRKKRIKIMKKLKAVKKRKKSGTNNV